MVCREVLCAEHHVLEFGGCQVSRIPLNGTCYSVFIKLTPLSGQTALRLDKTDQTNLQGVIQSKLEALSVDNETPYNEITRSFTMFYKTNVTGYIEYVVSIIHSIFRASFDIDDFLLDLILLQNDVLYYNREVVGFSVELAKYNLTVFDVTAKLLVPNLVDNSFDEFIAELRSFDDTNCFVKEAVPLSKLHVCPYIDLRIGEIPMQSVLDNIYFTDPSSDDIVIKNLTNWEFEGQSESIRICLKDYLIMANAIFRLQPDILSSAETILFNRFMLSFIILHDLKCWLHTFANIWGVWNLHYHAR